METLTVNYYFDKPKNAGDEQTAADVLELLGTESSTNIEQILCPKDSKNHQITITKFFHSQNVHRWLVTRINHISNTETHIFVVPRFPTKKEVFLTKTRKSHPNVIKKIQKGTLVEVEFGYVQQVKRTDGELKTNKRYPDMLHQGEMHKRRLAIVVGVKGSLVRVVPISSDENQNTKDKSIFEVSYTSVEELINYNDIDITSYAICNSMQTIAMSRILPPKSKRKNKPHAFRDLGYPHKLDEQDMKKFVAALSTSVGCGDYQSIKEEKNNLKTEKTKLQTQLLELELKVVENDRLHKVEKQFEALVEMMIDWKRAVSNVSLLTAKEDIFNEIEEYQLILSDEHT